MQVIPENTNPKWKYWRAAEYWEMEADQFRLLVEYSYESKKWDAWILLGSKSYQAPARFKYGIPTEAEAKSAAIEMAKDFAVSMLGILTNVEAK